MNRRPTSSGPIYLFLLCLIAWSGCSDDPNQPVVPQNSAPTIVSCTAEPATIPTSATSTLSVDAVDDDGDTLTYVWTANGGQFPDGDDSETVTWSPPDLTGTYTVTVTVYDGTDEAVETIELDVTVPEVVIDPTELDFGGETTGLQFSVINHGDGALHWSGTCDSDWLIIDPDSGDVSPGLDNAEAVTVTVDRTGLAPGAYDGEVVVTTPFGVRIVAVSLNVTTAIAPVLSLSLSTLDFGAETDEIDVEITNTGGGELTWTATNSAGWIEVNPAEGETEEETDILVVTVKRTDRTPGTFNGTVDIASNGGDESIAVTMIVLATPTLSLSTSTLDFGAETSELDFGISNTGEGELTWTATGSAGWLDVDPANGTTSETDAVTVTVDRSGLDPGDYQDTVNVVSDGGEESMTVTMTVTEPIPPAVALSTLTLDFEASTTSLELGVSNAGDGTLSWTAHTESSLLSLDPESGDATTETDVVTVTLDRTGLSPGGYSREVTVSGNGTEETAIVEFTVSPDAPTLTNLFFLHHSTGRNLIAEGSVRAHIADSNAGLEFWDHDYNYIGLSDEDGDLTGETYNIPGDDTYPEGLHTLWTTSNGAKDAILSYDVIAFKSCYPTCAITSDDMLEQYKSWYRDIYEVLDQYPDKVFILMSPPPLHRLATNSTQAARARAFADWLWTLDGGHIQYFNLFTRLANDDNVLRYEYERSHYDSDSHPNALANQAVGPIFADAMVAAAAGVR